MKNEIELKAKVDKLAPIRTKILARGAKRALKTSQRDVWFGSILLIQKAGYPFMVRVRSEDSGAYVTYKSVVTKQDGVYQELEYKISGSAEAESMFRAMGFDEVVVVKKEREQFQVGDFTVCLDKIQGLGNFIEVELIGTEDPETIQGKIKKFLKELGIKNPDIKKKGYIHLLLQKTKSPFLKYTY